MNPKIIKLSALSAAVLAILSGCNHQKQEAVEQPKEAAIQTQTADAPVPSQLPELAKCETFVSQPEVIVKSNDKNLSQQTITIGATGDMHGRIYAYDYALDAIDNNAGFTKIASLLKEERAADENMLLIDLGDTVQGNSAELFNDNPVHPVVETLNALNYDLWVPGNHEFDFERAFIDRNLRAFDGSVISSNILWDQAATECDASGDEIPFLRGFQLYDYNGAKVAVVGLTPSWVKVWQAASPENFRNLDFKDELEAVTATVDHVIEAHQPDVVIGAFHYGRKEHGRGVHEIASALADKIDVIFMGHEHARFIEQVNKGDDPAQEMLEISVNGEYQQEDKAISGVYNHENRHQKVKIIEPGNWGWALAKAQIELAKDENGNWQIQDTTLANRTVAGVEEDKALQEQMRAIHDASETDANTVIGNVEGHFTFSANGAADEAVLEDRMANSEGLRLYTTIHAAKLYDMPLVDVINQIQIRTVEEKARDKDGNAVKVDVSAAALFSDASNLYHGQDYHKKDSANLYMYDNELVAVNIQGAALKDYMEWSYAYFNQFKEGDLTVSFNPDIRAYNYDIFDGNIEYVVDLSQPARNEHSEGQRVQIESIAGAPFDPQANYVLAINDYRYGTTLLAQGWITESDVIWESSNEPIYAVRDMLTDYVAKAGKLAAADFTHPNWHILQLGTIDNTGQHQTKGDIVTLREGAGKSLWERLQNKEICVMRSGAGDRTAIHRALNLMDEGSWFVNPNYSDTATNEALYEGCAYSNQPQ
ncbi:bifunctional metallophosphatase/5'-nucleotidase [Thaumasiovibrio subtropicus]|uniref:bifunctional metallophosphatase/5'-nucleotidase n=1 Tax=Thaumasiovibrio subtropicus TaxID=1891207 RepID=UPI000B35A55A|nr:5'-nucleotidase C-terminal domain-containing protein [Thaumasiovibrio subtropicus]